MARTGEEALKVARRAKPLIVLLDVIMPGIDGYETCRRLKDDPETRDAAVIFLSALDTPKDKVRGFEAGAVVHRGRILLAVTETGCHSNARSPLVVCG